MSGTVPTALVFSMEEIDIIIALILALTLVVVFVYFQYRRLCSALADRGKNMSQRMYELAVLKELGDRIGYSLDVQKVVDIITGSLSQFIDYSAVAYMLIDQDRVTSKVHLEESVSKEFVDEVRERMLSSLSALLDKDLSENELEETLSGAIVIDERKDPVLSFFNIPLVISEKVVGVLTVANTKAGLYKEDEMTILYKIVNQASQAVTRLQEVVATEQSKLNAMVESMTEGVVMTDREYRIMVVNPAAKQAVNLKKENDISIFDFIDRLGGAFDIRGKLEESVKLDKVLIIDDVHIDKRFFQVLVAPVKSYRDSVEGETLGGVVIFHDITEEKRSERLREEFTSMMVHELRSPLDAIKKMVEAIEQKKAYLDKDVQKKYLELIHDNSARMFTLVSDLLDVAKLEAGKFEVSKEEGDIRNIIEETTTLFKATAKDAQISLVTKFGGQIPKGALFDPERTIQVLSNLLSNALKFTESGGTVAILVFVHKKGGDIQQEAQSVRVDQLRPIVGPSGIDDSIVIAVADSGVGIPKEQVGTLFDKFAQLKSAGLHGQQLGTGLGLAIAKGIVETQGGSIWVESEDGGGSTFYFTVPIDVSVGTVQ